jgi:hypothetical protein
MGKRSRRNRTPRQLPPGAPGGAPRPHGQPLDGQPAQREQSLLQAIADGELDQHLTALADAIHARHHLIHTVASATALSRLCVGDTVRINTTIKPRYLHGVHGKIIDIDDESATICVHRPIGRFHTGHIRCPPLALEKIGGAHKNEANRA